LTALPVVKANIRAEGSGTPDAKSFRSLVRVVGVSWSLLTKSEKTLFAIRIAARFALNGLDMAAIALMGLLGAITAVGLSGERFQLFGFSLPEPTAANVVALVGTVAALFIVKGGLAIWFTRWTAVFLAGVEIKNSAKIARYLFSGSLQRLRGHSRAEISFLVGPSTNATFSGVLGSLTTLVIESTLFVSIFVLFVAVDWVAAMFIAIYFSLLIFVLQSTTAARYLRVGRNVQKGATDSGASILEMVDGFREIAVLSKQSYFLTRFIDARKLTARTAVSLQILKSLPRYIAEAGLIVGALGFVMWQLSRGTLGEGLLALGIFLAGSFRMMGAILPLQSVWNELRVTQSWVVRAQEILVQLRDTPELLDASIYADTSSSEKVEERLEGQRGLEVELTKATFTHFGTDRPTIRSVSLHVPAGAYVAIVGPSGAGKTTLVDLILGLYSPESGTVRIDGMGPGELREMSPGLMAYVPQKPGLVDGSIAQNVALGVPPEEWDEGAIWSALERAQLAPHVSGMENTIHSSLGSHSDGLSGGQIQRLGLARALYTNPRLIILDEATSALDAATEASIAGAIQALGRDTTVIVIAHRLSTIQHADQVHVMENGEILASGTFKEVRKNVPLIEEYVKLMSFDED
jgi:ATP-binding cassette subfamily C protein